MSAKKDIFLEIYEQCPTNQKNCGEFVVVAVNGLVAPGTFVKPALRLWVSKTNNKFLVSWNGTVLLDMTNLPVSG